MNGRGQVYASAMRRAAMWCMQRSVAAMLIATVALGLAGLAAIQTTVDPSPEVYLRGTSQWAYYQKVDENYEIGETLIIAIREVGGTVFDVETITAVSELDRVLSVRDEVDYVLSLATATALDRQGSLRTLLPDKQVSRDTAIELAQRIKAHPVYSQLLVDERYETTFLFVRFSLDSPSRKMHLVREVREEVDRFAAKHRSVHLAGFAASKEAVSANVQRDVLLFTPAIILLLVILLWLIFNNLVASLIPLAVVGFSSALVVGALALFGVPINLITAAVPMIVLVVGIADSVHFLVELDRRFRLVGDRKTALADTVEQLAVPGLLIALTCSAGFLALLFSESRPLREFGVTVALGLLVQHVGLLLLAPLLFKSFRYPKRNASMRWARMLSPMLGKLVHQTVELGRRRMPVAIGISGLLMGGVFAAVLQLRTESDLVNQLSASHRLRRDLALIERTLGGTEVLELIVDSDQDGMFKTKAGLQALDELGSDLRGFEGISRIASLADYLKWGNAVISGVPYDQRSLPDTPEKIAQLALLDPTAFMTFTDQKMRQARVTLQVRAMPSEKMLELCEQAQRVAKVSLERSGLRATITGRPPMFAKIVGSLLEDALVCFVIAVVLVMIAMFVGLKSPTVAVAGMVSNMLAVGMTIAFMPLTGMRFGTIGVVLVFLGIGISVGSTMHIASRYSQCRAKANPEEAIRETIGQVGLPVLLVALLLWAGFSILCFSEFRPTFRMGLLTVVLVGFSMLSDLLLLPVLLVATDRSERRVR